MSMKLGLFHPNWETKALFVAPLRVLWREEKAANRAGDPCEASSGKRHARDPASNS